jgi:protein-S-isoprenylcysteine O-methyltransferase Ste14
MPTTRTPARRRQRPGKRAVLPEPTPAPPHSTPPAVSSALPANLGLALLLLTIVGVWMRFLLPGDPLHRAGPLLVLLITVVLAMVALTRRPARQRDGRWWVYLVCVISIVYPLGYAFDADSPWMGKVFWGRVSLQLLANVALLSLGRSYAMLPALREVRTGLFYGVVRHPVYGMYLLADSCSVSLMPSLWNLGIFLVGVTVFTLRAHLEERVLSDDTAYTDYMQRVRWRFFPGVY